MSSDQSSNATPTNTTTTNNNNNNNNSKKRKNMNDNNTKNNRTLMDYWAKKYHQSRELEIKSLMMMDSTTSSSSSSSSSTSDEKRPKFNDLLLTNNNNKHNNKYNDSSSNSKNPIEVDEDISIVDDHPIGVSSSNQDYNKWHKKSNKIQPNNNNTNNTNNANTNTNNNTNNTNSDDRWDSKHVKLPCSSHNTFLVTSPYHSSGNSLTKSTSKSKWYLIQTLLKQPISNVYELQDLIQSMKNCGNSGQQTSMDMTMLFDFFQSYIPRESRDEFFARILPWMQKMALRLPDLLPRSVPLLKKQRESSVELTAEQVACLMCHAFFCTFPRRDKLNNRRDHEYFTFPNINFTELYRGTRSVDTEKMMAAKLQTIVQYFDHVSRHESELSARTIGFHRRVIALYNGSKSKSTEYQQVLDYKDGDSEKEDDETEEENPILTMWKNSTEKLISCKVSLDGTIEDELNSSQVDFANKFIGGGVIGRGCVQEEIRFLINTECIISRLFTEEFDDNECMIIRGARRFSKYTGYADTYRFDGPYDGPVSDKEEIVCIDALNFVDRTMFRSTTDQYKPEWIQRELNKAYCSFQKLSYDAYNHDMKIATGHWGGGAFSGDRELKAIIQLMAASQAKREAVSYFAYADEDFVKKFDPMYSNLVCIEATVGELYTCLMEYRAKRVQARQKQKSIGIIGRVPSVLDFVFGWFVAETNDPFDEIPPTEPLTQPETILDTSTTENAETIHEKL